jgi:uncharacterized membrane protein
MNSSGRRIAEVERYIHELAIALSGLPADEREDVISGIREHIDDALLAIAEPTSADVRRILDGLGDPLAIAADAGARSGPTAPAPLAQAPSVGQSATDARPAAGTSQPVPLLQRDWIPAATVLALVVAALFGWAGGPGAWLLAALVWFAGFVALIASPLWSGVEKLLGTVVFGSAFGLFVATSSSLWWRLADLPGAGRALGGLHWVVGPVARLALVLMALAVAVGTAVWLFRRGSSRARR